MLRPRTEDLEDLSLNHLEYKVLRRGHDLRRLLEHEKGIDATMEHFDENRIIENVTNDRLRSTFFLATMKTGENNPP